MLSRPVDHQWLVDLAGHFDSLQKAITAHRVNDKSLKVISHSKVTGKLNVKICKVGLSDATYSGQAAFGRGVTKENFFFVKRHWPFNTLQSKLVVAKRDRYFSVITVQRT